MATTRRMRLLAVASMLMAFVFWLSNGQRDMFDLVGQHAAKKAQSPVEKAQPGEAVGVKYEAAQHNGASRHKSKTPPHPSSNKADKESAVATLFRPAALPVRPNAVIVDNAHNLSTADDFIPHLWAVTKLPSLSIADAKKNCTWGPQDKVNFQFAADVDWAKADRQDSDLESRRWEWHDFIQTGMIPYSSVASRFTNVRGVVVLAGNQDTVSRVALMLRALHRIGSRVAVEVHYFGDDEMTQETRDGLASIWPRIFFNDLAGDHNIVRTKKDGPYINYQLKTAALINSRFAAPLLLDSDNIPLMDPETLYDSRVYREFGTVFWPDIARTRPQNPAWAISNTACRMDEWEVESGQLLVDKRRFWYHLQLAAWWNNQHGKYYNEFLLGDKDMFRFAWHALRTEYGRPRRWLASVGTLNDGFYCGHSFAQHHPDDGRVAFLHGGLVKTASLDVMRWNRDEKGGYYRHYKRAPSDEDPLVVVNVGIKFDPAEYMPNRGPGDGVKAAMCTDMYDVEARDLDELVPSFEKSFREMGGYWQLEPDKAHHPEHVGWS